MGISAAIPLRQVLEERVRQLVLDTENLFVESRDRARRDMADQLNQAVRRIRQAANLEDVGATLVDASAPFSTSAALFGVSGDFLQAECIRGVPQTAAREFESLELTISSAPALAGAIESRDPMVTVTSLGEVSSEIARIFDHSPVGRATVFPLLARDGVPALLYAWGSVQAPALELLVQMASLVWISFTEPAHEPAPPPAPAPSAPPELVTIAPATKAASSWEELSPEEQRVHLQAQRFARVQVSEMRLFEQDAVQSGRADRNLYEALRAQIDAARDKFRSTFFTPCPSMVDYLHLEFVRTLANDDPELLGKDYPGPLV